MKSSQSSFCPFSSNLEWCLTSLVYFHFHFSWSVRGMMYYRRALLLQSFVENSGIKREMWLALWFLCILYFIFFFGTENRTHNSRSFEKSDISRAYADMKFVYLITCQIFGQQKENQDKKADDILYLLKEYDLKFNHVSCTLTFVEV
mgnify:CR=1 FL=1